VPLIRHSCVVSQAAAGVDEAALKGSKEPTRGKKAKAPEPEAVEVAKLDDSEKEEVQLHPSFVAHVVSQAEVAAVAERVETDAKVRDRIKCALS
jgi:hypothetical protein